MTRFQIPAGSQVMIGAPANPPAPQVLSALASYISLFHEVAEAHLVQCSFPGIPDGDCQAIVIVAENTDSVSSVVDRIVRWLNESLPKGTTLNVWPMRTSNSILPLVRDAHSALVSRPNR